MEFEKLYEVAEQCEVNFIGYISERTRYDFAIIFTDSFFGKALVVCMQTGKSGLFSLDDLDNLYYLQRVLSLENLERSEELSVFLRQRIPDIYFQEQF